MAHVLLPCDLPSWLDVQRYFTQLGTCTDARQMARAMANIYDICCVSLDPDDQRLEEAHPGVLELCRFVEDVMSETERSRFLKETLPRLASRAADLKRVKPVGGFLYSLRKEEGRFELERSLVASLLANAFFSTFPKRNAKTHPTLQDFRMIDFFTHLHKRNHQKKLKAFLRYFENLDTTPGGIVTFTRKVIQGPSLPGWLCSDRPLVPLVLRPDGDIDQVEPHVYRACSCSPHIGGDVLKASTSKEARLFFSFPELLVIMSFVESLADDEALIADNAGMQGGVCFLDPTNFSEDLSRQFEDRFLLRELNKALAAFMHDKEEVDVRRVSFSSKSQSESRRGTSQQKRNSFQKRMSSQNSSKVSMKTASQSSVDAVVTREEYYTADEDSDDGGGYTEETSLSRSAESLGFVLGEGGSDDDDIPQHERLEDFRKRIRKRTRRRLSRRRSSSSYAGSSSDMDDILEDPEPQLSPCCIRPASSEPSLLMATEPSSLYKKSPLSEAAETVLVQLSGKKMMVTSSNGHLKAYSYDGVSPNLPVPFKARFRQRQHKSEEGNPSLDRASFSIEDEAPSLQKVMVGRRVAVEADDEGGDLQLRVSILWLAASMAELQSLILYTLGQAQLNEVSSVYGQVLRREWTVGDLSCEVLRFCRNRLYPKRRPQVQLFSQIIGQPPSTPSQDSLD